MGAESLISSRLFQPVFPCEFRLHGLSHHSNCVAGCWCVLTCGLVSHFCSFCFLQSRLFFERALGRSMHRDSLYVFIPGLELLLQNRPFFKGSVGGTCTVIVCVWPCARITATGAVVRA